MTARAAAEVLKAVEVVTLFLVAWVLQRLLDRGVERMFSPAARLGHVEPGRARTLSALLRSFLRYAVGVAAVLAAFLLVVPAAALPAAGLAGLLGAALGFGAQNFVRDVIAGFFIIYEDQFRVGEVVDVGLARGTVIEIGLRVTKLCNADGALQVLPNGKIEGVTNLSRSDQIVVVDLPIPYVEDLERLEAALARACEAVAGADGMAERLVEGPRLLGVGALREQSVVYQVWARCRPSTQLDVARALRRALVLAAGAAGIPWPSATAR